MLDPDTDPKLFSKVIFVYSWLKSKRRLPLHIYERKQSPTPTSPSKKHFSHLYFCCLCQVASMRVMKILQCTMFDSSSMSSQKLNAFLFNLWAVKKNYSRYLKVKHLKNCVSFSETWGEFEIGFVCKLPYGTDWMIKSLQNNCRQCCYHR